MIIKEMFQDDIDRYINGVVKVAQEGDILVQEIEEYVITKELKKHIIHFFNNYNDAELALSGDTACWISGFFGSGKSHFLKILSYLLANKEVAGIKTVERFRNKFADDPATFMLIDEATKGQTDTILFNIDYEGSVNKDKTAVLRVFAKMFYNYLGFYGEDLKVARLEKFIDDQGKTAAFRAAFEATNGESWLEARSTYDFFEDDVVEVMTQVLGMSETAARNWFNGSQDVEFSISKLVDDIRKYVEMKPKDFRLLFMIDEVGQYVGDSTDLLINLQSLVEKLGSDCKGKVWVVCTGQEAIDEIIKTRENEFSRIQARFKTRLSLSSSSADEVIQKRILSKKPEVKQELEKVYIANDSVMRNLFSFKDALLDIKGYNGSDDFVRNFPFVPYQFIILQKVFAEIRKHGNSGKHLSGGERSMLSGFQEAAQKIEFKDEFSIAPFYLFYDTVHTFLDSSIRRVIERCQKAADTHAGIEQYDVNVLKMLYMIRYIDDISANIENMSILMADDLRSNKMDIRNLLRGSLDRLQSQNYIARTGDIYNFLTDEEQDIQREIKNTVVDTSTITQRIANIIFDDIYVAKKYRYDKYDFAFDKMVDNTFEGQVTGGMMLKFLSVATDDDQKNDMHLQLDSKGKVIVALGATQYYDSLEYAMKIRKYIKMRNVPQLPRTQQDILRNHQDEATKLEANSRGEIEKAITSAKFYVDGEIFTPKPGDAKAKINQAMEYLVSQVYKELTLINKNADTDTDIQKVLRGEMQPDLYGKYPNDAAAVKVDEFLQMRHDQKMTVSMADLQDRYQKIPYGWKEIDIAQVVALLMYEQKVTIKQGGTTISIDNPKLVDMLRKKTLIGTVTVAKRQTPPQALLREALEFLRDYSGKMDIPTDEDGLVRYIKEYFGNLETHYKNLQAKYAGHNYPDKELIDAAVAAMTKVVEHGKDNFALLKYVTDNEDALYDIKEKTEDIQGFFRNQVTVFDNAVRFEKAMSKDREYIEEDENAKNALDKIRLITLVKAGTKFVYKQIPELNNLMNIVKALHDKQMAQKREELENLITAREDEVKTAAQGHENLAKVRTILERAADYYGRRRNEIKAETSLRMLDGMPTTILNNTNNYIANIQSAIEEENERVYNPPVDPGEQPPKPPKPPKPQVVKTYSRQSLMFSTKLHSDAEIDDYVEKLRIRLKSYKKDCDVLELQ